MKNITNYIKINDYKGYDPFDSLNTPFFFPPLTKSKLLGVAVIQFFKRCPINLRPLFLIKKSYNPKALALFIRGLIQQNNIKEAKKLAEILITLKSKRPYACWGYNFPWYAKAFVVPKWEPNLVTTVFVADALFDLYDATKEEKYKKLAIDTKNFLIKELILEETKTDLCFRYIPNKSVRVHNANSLGAKLLSRIYKFTEDIKLKQLSDKSVSYSIKAQNKDGSWPYGEMDHHQWIDNFHTGYNLCAISEYQKNTKTTKYNTHLNNGLAYHINNHYTKDLIPKYFNNKLYPIDCHNYAQGILTFIEFERIDLAKKLAKNAIETMQDKKKGYFYYQKTKYYINKIPYIRWVQAWMFYSLSKLENIKKEK